jgi:hypothetical protein
MFKIAALALAVAVAGCYVPGEFTAKIRIDAETGAYTLAYDGELIDSGLLQKLAEGALDADDEADKVAAATRDLARDRGFTGIEYRGGGVFAVRYARQGNIHQHRYSTFVSQNSRIVSISYIADDEIIKVLGGAVPSSYHEQLLAIDYGVRGELRVVTSGAVIDHNATKVLGGPETTYIWIFRSIDDRPARLIIG